MDESGAEKLYVTSVDRPLVNMGVSVVGASGTSLIDPWLLGSKDERDVQGYAGTPVNQNNLLPDFGVDIGAAGVAFPRQKRYYVSVDSGSDPFTDRSLPGPYELRSWRNDLEPPVARVLTTRVAAGRPTIVARVLDAKSGVDPSSLTIAYQGVLVGAAFYDPVSGLALFPLPIEAPPILSGKTHLILAASDFQESKNLETISKNIMPNTTFKTVTLLGVEGPALTWLAPRENQCLSGKTSALSVVASSNKRIRSVRFFADGRQVAITHSGSAELFSATWHIAKVARGLATDAPGKHVSVPHPVRVCK
jgi:hypothetical protein